MKRRNLVAGASAVTAFVSAADLAFAQAGGTLGVILMHGKHSKYLVAEAGHRDTNFAASQRIVGWIRGLAAR